MDQRNSIPYLNYKSGGGAGSNSTPYNSFLSYYGGASSAPNSVPNNVGIMSQNTNQNNQTNKSNCPSNTSSPTGNTGNGSGGNGKRIPASSNQQQRQMIGPPPFSLSNPNYSPYHRTSSTHHHHQQHHQNHHHTNYRHYYHHLYGGGGGASNVGGTGGAGGYCVGVAPPSSSSPPLLSSSPAYHHPHQHFTSNSYGYFHPSVKLQQLGNRLQSWKTASIGISFLVLLLLICKLHDVDREINYLHHISNEWLSQHAVNQQILLLSSSSSSSSSPPSSLSGASPEPLQASSIIVDNNSGDDDSNVGTGVGGILESRSDNSHNLYSLVLNATSTISTSSSPLSSNVGDGIIDHRHYKKNGLTSSSSSSSNHHDGDNSNGSGDDNNHHINEDVHEGDHHHHHYLFDTKIGTNNNKQQHGNNKKKNSNNKNNIRQSSKPLMPAAFIASTSNDGQQSLIHHRQQQQQQQQQMTTTSRSNISNNNKQPSSSSSSLSIESDGVGDFAVVDAHDVPQHQNLHHRIPNQPSASSVVSSSTASGPDNIIVEAAALQQQQNHHRSSSSAQQLQQQQQNNNNNLIVTSNSVGEHQVDVLDLAQIISLISYLKEDVDVLMGELMASRTTLLLSLVFILVYILSWCWMAYAIRATNTPQDISLKTVLLLAIFAAVDIAASAGFVMVRIIMYLMRDHYFPRDMRMPLHSIEYNQLAAYIALRFVSMKSGTGTIDIFVSVIVTFLTSLRVYSVICAVTFYRRARKELLNVKNFEYMIERPHRYPSQIVGNHHNHHNSHSHHHPHQHPHHQSTGYLRSSMVNTTTKSSPTNSTNIIKESQDLGQSGYLPKIRLLSAHKDLERRFSINNGRDHSSNTIVGNNGNGNGNNGVGGAPATGSGVDVNNSSSDVSSDEDPAQELKIQAADMPAAIQKSAMQSTIHALRTYTTEKHIAESIKQNFDQLYEPTWHCIVGRNWGSCVTHTKSNYIRMLYKDLTILLYKSS